MTAAPTTPPTELLAAPTSSGVSISGGVTVGVISVLALIGFVWLIATMIKKDKLKVTHVIAVTLTVFVFQLTPIGQLAFGQLMTILDGVSAVAA